MASQAPFECKRGSVNEVLVLKKLGATVGVLPCLDISSSVTAFGRTMIDHTKQMVEACIVF